MFKFEVGKYIVLVQQFELLEVCKPITQLLSFFRLGYDEGAVGLICGDRSGQRCFGQRLDEREGFNRGACSAPCDLKGTERSGY